MDQELQHTAASARGKRGNRVGDFPHVTGCRAKETSLTHHMHGPE